MTLYYTLRRWRSRWLLCLYRVGLRQWLCWHHYWPQIREDGAANVEKCGKCGKVKP